MPIKAYYNSAMRPFLEDQPDRILGVLASEHHHSLEEQQRSAWLQQISILQTALRGEEDGRILLEFYIPRMGKRADAVLVTHNIVFVIEFKIGAREHALSAFNQVEDYALDLKNFHEGSHTATIVPVLVSTHAPHSPFNELHFAEDLVASPVGTNATDLRGVIEHICCSGAHLKLDTDEWITKGYRPTPTIIEAAQVLYRTHSVAEISRSEADEDNLIVLHRAVNGAIDRARQDHTKVICLVTGVPGSGKTLAGLNIATRRSDQHRDEHAVFLSGNGPLVDVLREALTRDKADREGVSKRAAGREVRAFVQNIHHFRDHYVGNLDVPIEKVVVFDEAQRAWTREQTAAFMERKRGQPNFDMSEPEFLISVMDRHRDWCTLVCLIGGGQEINTGEAGISEWLNALRSRFTNWRVHVSPRISLSEYGPQGGAESFLRLQNVRLDEYLHLAVSVRSFRAETLSALIGQVLDNQPEAALSSYQSIKTRYPIYLTRSLSEAKRWLRGRARGTERYGLTASSGAQRLRPEGIHVKADIEPANWFLNDNRDVRSSFYLEDVATEFAVQGLELDWAGICWDGDFYYDKGTWLCQTFKGSRWQCIRDESKRLYLKNAYRVLLTRARQGMVICVPSGDPLDHTRPDTLYDGTFDYLRRCGFPVVGSDDG